jgi:hypothetical protein
VSKREALDRLLNNRRTSEIQKPVNTGIQEGKDTEAQETVYKPKKATFEFDPQFHTELKIFAAERNKNMVDVVVVAVKEYMERHR